MTMRYAYFPGCSANTTGASFTVSTAYVARAIGFEMPEIPDWNCCGAGHTPNETVNLGLNARNLALSEEANGDMPVMATCAACHADLPAFVHGIQEKMEERTIAIGAKLEDLTNKLADAVAAGTYAEEELEAIRSLNRKGQFYWDFVFVENAEGAHNSRLTNECLDKAEKLIDEALGLIKA